MRSQPARRGARIARPKFVKVFLLETAILLAVTAIIGLLCERMLAVSILLGGIIALIPHIYFTYQAFRFTGAKAAQQVSQAFYRGQAGKFILNLLLFALVFMLIQRVDVLALFAGYILMLIGNWIGAVMVIQHRSK